LLHEIIFFTSNLEYILNEKIHLWLIHIHNIFFLQKKIKQHHN